MPAVDYRLPGGLRLEELDVVLRTALASRRAVGMEVTIYNPALDPGGGAGRSLAAVLAQALGRAAPGPAIAPWVRDLRGPSSGCGAALPRRKRPANS